MLERNRRELDALAVGSKPPLPARTASPAAPSSRAPLRSAAEQILDDKLGGAWRYDVLERVRDGDDLIVRVRVTEARRGISRTQYGSASLNAPTASKVQGKTGNVAFSLAGSTSPRGEALSSLSRERSIEHAAIESALMACARLL